jgi:hypothetical protein
MVVWPKLIMPCSGRGFVQKRTDVMCRYVMRILRIGQHQDERTPGLQPSWSMRGELCTTF